MRNTPTVNRNCRVYAVGDIHGRYDVLMPLLDKIEDDITTFDDERSAKLVFVGDYIDRGDDSRRVIETLMELVEAGDREVICLLGNHEDALGSFLEDPVRGKAWIDYGGRQTLASYGVRPPDRQASIEELVEARDRLSEALGGQRSFLSSLVTFYENGEVIFTHAGVNPDVNEPGEDVRSMVWGTRAVLVDRPLPGKLLVHGHFDDAEPVHVPGRICVDTGAYYTGRLTAVRLDEGVRFMSVSAA